MVNFLLKHGADPSLVDNYNETPKQWALSALKYQGSKEEIEAYTNIIRILNEKLDEITFPTNANKHQQKTTTTTYSKVLPGLTHVKSQDPTLSWEELQVQVAIQASVKKTPTKENKLITQVLYENEEQKQIQQNYQEFENKQKSTQISVINDDLVNLLHSEDSEGASSAEEESVDSSLEP